MQIFMDDRMRGEGVDILVNLDEVTTPTAGEVISNEYWAVDKHNGMLHIYFYDGELYPQCNEDLHTANSNCVIAYGLSAKSKQIETVYVGDDLKSRVVALVKAYDDSKVVALTPGKV